MKKVAVLGAGRVGEAIIKDLSVKYSVLACDRYESALKSFHERKNVQIRKIDIAHADFHELFREIDLVISAVPGFMGYHTLQRIIESGNNVVDISFFPEDALNLNDLARSRGVCAIVDCGVAPGMGNIILGRHNEEMDIHTYECLVGGLPVERKWPYQYKAGFSPIDVIEEYIRPARFVQNGRIISKEALSDVEMVHFDKVGTLESFNTDGLRSLIHTMNIPNMIEKTLRYPGTVEYLKVLRESGFFSYEELDINGIKIKPVDVSSRLLFPIWKLEKGESDITVMRITICGKEKGIERKIIYHLYDQYDPASQTSSMARTTGYTCTAVAELVLNGHYFEAGINPPEYLGKDNENFGRILDYLEARGVTYLTED